MRTARVFLPEALVDRLRARAAHDPRVAETLHDVVEAAEPWARLSDDELWHLMYGPTITRSWDVWSTGHCAACAGDVPLYNWVIDAWARPWKVMCPHCRELFPKNDFLAYYRSGLDAHNLFDYRLADSALLFNAEHPDPADPLHAFGVDDGEGYVDGERRWRFIGAYLIYGQWKQLVLGGINHLAGAYLATGEAVYARKAGILLDRVADLYPSFDHMTQAWVEEVIRTDGYVSTWHDACEETREMALAYDAVRPEIAADEGLAAFLAEQARQYALPRPKATPGDVCANIERGLLHDPLRNLHKIHSNYPRREIAVMVIRAVLGGEEDRAEFHRMLDDVLERATAVDGVTGEKGLTAYSAYVIQSLAVFLAQLERLQPGMLAELLRRHPRLAQTYRFHIDTWCGGQQYYPQIGDAEWFAKKTDHYRGITLTPGNTNRSRGSLTTLLAPSMFDFMWRLYTATGDPAYVQVLYHENGGMVDGLPHDLLAENPETFQRQVAEVIATHGAVPQLGNVLKREWHLAILRSGQGERERDAWLIYDLGGNHSHANGLNLGLFAKGLDLMPDFGYPPLQISGAGGPHVNWYITTAAHNTVVIDGESQPRSSFAVVGGQATLWGDGRAIAAVRASCAEILLERNLTQAAVLTGAGHEQIGLYLHTPGTVYRVQVYTKPDDAPPGEEGWTLQFEDAFDRDSLGPDWQTLDGEWTVANGTLAGVGTLLCTRRFAGNHRVVFEASTEADPPCDLSAFLAGSDRWLRGSAFFGFGSHFNTMSKLTLVGREAVAGEARIVPGARHSILCERDGVTFRHVVDGVEINRFLNTDESIRQTLADARRGKQYERTIARLDISESDSYFLDLFRVIGGSDHAKFMHSHFGTLATEGLAPAPAEEFGHDTLMRNFLTDPAPVPGWHADWQAEDRYGLLPDGAEVHLRYTDLTPGAEVSTCEGWIIAGHFNQTQEAWIPRLLVRRRGPSPLASTFVGVIEPYEGAPRIAEARRLPLVTPAGEAFGEAHVAVEVRLHDGRRDVLIAADAENPSGHTPSLQSSGCLLQPDRDIRLEGEFCVVRYDPSGRVYALALGNGQRITAGHLSLSLDSPVEFVEATIDGDRITVIAGDTDQLTGPTSRSPGETIIREPAS